MPAPVGEIDRRTYLGSSDVAAILGVSPWKTALDVYFAKLGEPEEITPEKRKLFSRGKRMEPVVLDMLIEENPDLIITRRSTATDPNRYTDREHPFMAAEIDFEWSDNGAIENGEVKTVHPFSAGKWGEVDTDEVPIEYAAQVMYGLMVTARNKTKFATLIGADNLLCYEIQRDEETIAAMRRKCVDFWHNNVLARVPPDPVNMDDLMRLFARTKGVPVEADEVTLNHLENLRAIRSRIKAMDDEKEEIEFQIASFICRQWGIDYSGDSATGDDAILTRLGQPFATWKSQSRSSIDAKRLRAEAPVIAAAYTNISFSRSIRFPKQKGV